jgi:heme exporter protein A
MLDEVLREVAGRGHTVVMTSHDLPRAVDLATRVDIISKGKIAASINRGDVPPEEMPALYRSVTHD